MTRNQLKADLRAIGLTLTVEQDSDTPVADWNVEDSAGEVVACGTSFLPSALVGDVLDHPVIKMKLQKGRAA